MRWTPALEALGWLVDRPIAHRGLHDIKVGAVENTATAFARAIERGYPIECDLQITAEGEAVVFHDDTVDRLTEGSGFIRDKTLSELRCLAFKVGKDRIQTLDELLDQVGGRVPLVVELKSHWDGDFRLPARALEVVADYRGAYGIMSFDPDIVAEVRRLSPRTVRGVVTDRATYPYYHLMPLGERVGIRYLVHLPRTEPHFISYFWRDLPFPPVTAYRESGRPVITWTLRSPEDAARARRYSDQITFEGFLA
ncbi:MAG: glycerophosphodiester phosphodiesterase family protein [Hyphomicrobiales bacterium]